MFTEQKGDSLQTRGEEEAIPLWGKIYFSRLEHHAQRDVGAHA
jgi:hypothetical protein